MNADARFHPLNNLLYRGNSITASHLLSFSIEKIWFLVKVYLYFDKWEKKISKTDVEVQARSL